MKHKKHIIFYSIYLISLSVFCGCKDKSHEDFYNEDNAREPNKTICVDYETRFPKYDCTPKGPTLKTYQVKARFVEKGILYDNDYKKEMLESFMRRDKKTYEKLKNEFDGWFDFDDTIIHLSFCQK
ncbi:MAG: hypothetical protein ABFR90_04465 [Planctomycetota bacterium]